MLLLWQTTLLSALAVYAASGAAPQKSSNHHSQVHFCYIMI